MRARAGDKKETKEKRNEGRSGEREPRDAPFAMIMCVFCLSVTLVRWTARYFRNARTREDIFGGRRFSRGRKGRESNSVRTRHEGRKQGSAKETHSRGLDPG